MERGGKFGGDVDVDGADDGVVFLVVRGGDARADAGAFFGWFAFDGDTAADDHVGKS